MEVQRRTVSMEVGTLQGVDDPTFQGACLPTDVLVHGWKKMGAHLISPEIYGCTNVTNDAFHPGTSILKTCPLKSWNSTMDFIKSNCFWHYQGCVETSSDGDIRNRCYDPNYCSTSWYFRTGVGHQGILVHNIREGMLIKCPAIAGKSVYLLSNGSLHAFSGLQSFISRGYDFDQV